MATVTKKQKTEDKVVKLAEEIVANDKPKAKKTTKKAVKVEPKKETKKTKVTKPVKKEKGIFNYFKEVKTEMSKVKWPTKKEMITYTMATLVFIIFFAAFFLLIEVIFAWLKTV